MKSCSPDKYDASVATGNKELSLCSSWDGIHCIREKEINKKTIKSEHDSPWDTVYPGTPKGDQ